MVTTTPSAGSNHNNSLVMRIQNPFSRLSHFNIILKKRTNEGSSVETAFNMEKPFRQPLVVSELT